MSKNTTSETRFFETPVTLFLINSVVENGIIIYINGIYFPYTKTDRYVFSTIRNVEFV